MEAELFGPVQVQKVPFGTGLSSSQLVRIELIGVLCADPKTVRYERRYHQKWSDELYRYFVCTSNPVIVRRVCLCYSVMSKLDIKVSRRNQMQILTRPEC